VLLNRIVEGQPTAFLQQKHRGGGELLRNRRHAETRGRAVGHLPLDVSQSVAFREHHVAAARHEHRS
jgi:hypothetical protein